MHASYFDPFTDELVEVSINVVGDLAFLLKRIKSLHSQRGHPALELRGTDGSSLSFATDGERAYLVWVNSLGESFHSIGTTEGEPMVFDYFGSWSEAPASCLVSLEYAKESVDTYVLTGKADTDWVLFEPD